VAALELRTVEVTFMDSAAIRNTFTDIVWNVRSDLGFAPEVEFLRHQTLRLDQILHIAPIDAAPVRQ
jgi:hypothetical protein